MILFNVAVTLPVLLVLKNEGSGVEGSKGDKRKTLSTCAAVFILVAFFPLNAFASVEISASVKPTTVTIGERFDYEIVIKMDAAPQEPPLRLDAKGPFELLDAKIIKGGGGEMKIVFTMAAFKTGKLELPAYEYDWVDSEGNP
ncbi:MAG: BatD family protein, partial [Nitrospinota bacterium]